MCKSYKKLIDGLTEVKSCTCEEIKAISRATTFHDTSYSRMAFLLEHGAQAIRDKDFATLKYLLQQGAKAYFPCEFAAHSQTPISEIEQVLENLSHNPENKMDAQKLECTFDLLKL